MHASSSEPRLALLISGRGSNMLAILAYLKALALPVSVVGVWSNRPDAEGLARAAALGVPTQAIDHRAYASREAFDAALADALEAQAPTLIVLAGFMRILTPAFCERFAGRMLNIHPSLLPAYPGLHTHARALADGVPLHGASVHAVTPGLDQGPVLAQAAVPVLPDDTADVLAERVLEVEHPLYCQAVAAVLAGLRVWQDGRWHVGSPRPGFERVQFSPVLLHSRLMAQPQSSVDLTVDAHPLSPIGSASHVL